MATYLSTVNGLLLSDIFYVCATTGQQTGVILNAGDYLPVGKIDPISLQRSVESGSIYRAVNQSWLTAATALTSATFVLSSGVRIITGGATVTISQPSGTTLTLTL